MPNGDSWSRGLGDHLVTLQRTLDVSLDSQAESILDPEVTDAVLARMTASAGATAADGVTRCWDWHDVRFEVRRDGAPSMDFAGPVLGGDTYGGLAKRLVTKAKQTREGPPAWIRTDELGGIFMLTDWSSRPREIPLSHLTANLRQTLGEWPHVLGVVLSAGAAPWGNTVIDRASYLEDDSGRLHAAVIDRQLPGGRARRSFVVGINESGSGFSVERVAQWCREEPTWLDWALGQLGKPSLFDVLLPVAVTE